MKNRLQILLMVLLTIPFISRSQLRLALSGGPVSASVQEKNSLMGWQNNTEPYFTSRNGLHLGALVEVPLNQKNRWFLHPGLLYMPKGQKFNRSFDSLTASITDTASFASSLHTNYIEIPFNLTHKFPLGKKTTFLLSAGPYIAFFYNGKKTLETRKYSNNRFIQREEKLEVGNDLNRFKTLDAGWNARAGFEFGNVWLTGFISQGLKNFYKAPYEATFNHKVFGASVSIWLNKASVTTPKDSDGDGLPDKEDDCPAAAGSLLTKGCPDKDGDGISDKNDKCPDAAGLARYDGCPVPDTDGDGVNDEEDKCIDVAGLKKYKGCPVPDTDGDGINDEEDKCPEIAGNHKYNGCPVPDRDKDGINDEDDRCPDVAGERDNQGCPVIKKEVREKVKTVARNVLFGVNSAQIEPGSFKSLDELVEIMRTNQSAGLRIEGHTDNTGAETYNQLLSQRRADAIKDYLVNKGISVNRLKSTGFGSVKPITDNSTKEGRNRNRRVELILVTSEP